MNHISSKMRKILYIMGWACWNLFMLTISSRLISKDMREFVEKYHIRDRVFFTLNSRVIVQEKKSYNHHHRNNQSDH